MDSNIRAEMTSLNMSVTVLFSSVPAIINVSVILFDVYSSSLYVSLYALC